MFELTLAGTKKRTLSPAVYYQHIFVPGKSFASDLSAEKNLDGFPFVSIVLRDNILIALNLTFKFRNMRIISYNVNGLRAALKKGFVEWLQTNPADIICLQETKSGKEDVDCSLIEKMGYETHWFSAEKKGYSGVAIFTKIKPTAVFYGNKMMQSDAEGRVIRADYGDLTLINAYFPSGTSGDLRQEYKYVWLEEFLQYIIELKKTRPRLVVTGDYNIAHKEIDIHDPKGNKKNSGFLPEERAWMDKWLASGMADSFRTIHPNEPHRYSWWSQRFPSVRLNNKGWRIDYISITENLVPQVKDAEIFPFVKHSDHCPVYLELNGFD